jgi:hypothetical protein
MSACMGCGLFHKRFAALGDLALLAVSRGSTHSVAEGSDGARRDA